MKILSLAIDRYKTRVSDIEIKKDKAIIHRLFEDKSILPRLQRKDQEAITKVIHDLISTTGKDRLLHIVLPAKLVLMECGETEVISQSAETTHNTKWASNLLKVSESEYGFTFIKNPRRGGYYQTVAAVPKDLIQVLYAASLDADADLTFIEPEPISVLRYLDCYRNSLTQFFIEENHTTVTGYNATKGCFSRVKPFGFQEILSRPEEFKRQVMLSDVETLETFGAGAEPIFISSERAVEIKKILQNTELAARIIPDSLNPHIEPSGYNANQLMDFAAPLGVALQMLYERRAAFENANEPPAGKSLTRKAN